MYINAYFCIYAYIQHDFHTNTYRPTRTHAGLHGHIQAHTDTYRPTQTHTGPHGHIQAYTDTYKACNIPGKAYKNNLLPQSGCVSLSLEFARILGG